ncbi:DsbA family protein [Bacillus sp. MUM 13]|uniref:DsbA family protein n=1 Tax=Bacillus sp. MUM 13 TaxID=1678001 RepID=UPI0008F57059|nr:DsbA family protein [Bacillus sp. MUM 13]OIK09444.1 thiol-disulfide oxidoreductase [Bacillus sp. MUM 13]
MANKQKNKNSVHKQKKSNTALYVVLGVVIAAIVVFIVLAKTAHNDSKIDYSGQPVLGDKSASVKIVEFGDYKCPYCKNFTLSAFPQIDKEIVKKGKASFYFFNYPFINNDSTRSSRFAEAVYKELGNDAFWEFHDKLYAAQPDDRKYEQIDYFTEDKLVKVLRETASKEDADKVLAAFRAGKSAKASDKDVEIANKLGVESTPAIFVNGKQFKGKTLEDLKKMVEKASD